MSTGVSRSPNDHDESDQKWPQRASYPISEASQRHGTATEESHALFTARLAMVKSLDIWDYPAILIIARSEPEDVQLERHVRTRRPVVNLKLLIASAP